MHHSFIIHNQGLEGAVRAGLEERGQMSSRQEVKLEHKVSVAAFTSRDEKWVGDGREEDTTEGRWEGEREHRDGREKGSIYTISAVLFCHGFSLFFPNSGKRQSTSSAECDISAQPWVALGRG